MFQGSIVALVTPMDERGQLDLPALRKLLDFHLVQGSDALVIAGTTGEGATLSEDELRSLITVAVGQVAGRAPVIAGTGTADTRKSLQLTRIAAECGADAALVVTPYYNRPNQRGLEMHFSTIADATDLPLVLYNVPARTAVDLLPETVARLARRGDIVAIKEARADVERIQDLLDRCAGDIAVLSGDDTTCMEAMLRGAAGVVSVAANVVPRRMHELCRAASSGDAEAASAIDGRMHDLYRMLAVEPNPIPVKWSVYKMGLIGTGIRLPLLPLEEKYQADAADCLRALGLLKTEPQEHDFEKA